MSHRVRFTALLAPACAAVLLASGPVSAQPATGDVHKKLEARHGSGVKGNVTLHPQGKNKTLIRVNMFNTPRLRPSLSLHSGADCIDSASATHPIPLNPVSSGNVSQTVVSIPLQSLTSSHFVVDVRDATARRQFVQACSRLQR